MGSLFSICRNQKEVRRILWTIDNKLVDIKEKQIKIEKMLCLLSTNEIDVDEMK